MTDNQLKRLADSCGLDLKYVTKWEPPADDDLRPLIAMPNIPKPCHALAPRTLLGTSTWDRMRRACYAQAEDTCEICGDCPEEKRRRHGHEAYKIDYETGTVEFVRVYCLCSLCHLGCIHTGRAITLYNQKNPLYPKEFLLEGAKKAFTIISSYNHDHPEADLRAYSTFIEYLRYDELCDPMLELIRKYNIKFYQEDPKKTAKWKEWKLIIGKREYPTPYANESEWRHAMEEQNENDTARIAGRNMESRFSGGVYDVLNAIISGEEKKSLADRVVENLTKNDIDTTTNE